MIADFTAWLNADVTMARGTAIFLWFMLGLNLACDLAERIEKNRRRK